MSSWPSIETHSQNLSYNKQHTQPQPQSHAFLSEFKKMVKFSKQFEGQLVPEWKEAFVDYWQLKKNLKKIHLLNTTTDNTPTKQQIHNSIPNTLFSSLKKFTLFGHQHKDHGAIQVLITSLNFSLFFLFKFYILIKYPFIFHVYMD
jgi:hypothetical protein